MSRANHKPRIGELGWCLLDWEYAALGPQWSFVAGSMPACRLQLDRFRRELQMVGSRSQLQFLCWTTVETKFSLRSGALSYTTTETEFTCFPQSKSIRTAFTPREAKVYQTSSGGFLWWSARYENDVTNTTYQMTIAGRWYLDTWISHAYSDRRRINFVQPGTNARVRMLAIAHNNSSDFWSPVTL